MNFEQFNFHPDIAQAIRKQGYKVPTAIQQKAIPRILSGNDLLGLAQTGTGKTAAFILPILQKLLKGPRKVVRSLILTPTRELAEQINENVREMSGNTGLRCCAVYGGVSKNRQINTLKKGVEIVVACPGRLLDLINVKSIDLSGIEALILDEADRMFDKGFLPDVRRILTHIPKQRQSMVFSATMPGEIRHLVEEILSDPVIVQAAPDKPVATIKHSIFQVEQSRKTALLKTVLEKKQMATTLVFTRTKHKAMKLAKYLQNEGFRATSLQGNLSQNQRKAAMGGFRSGKFNIMVATDIAARGIDVSGISHVVNFDVPDTVEAYTHRTGRTGRAECTGEAFTFMTSDDRRIIQIVERTLGQKIRRESISGFDCGDVVPLPSRNKKQYPKKNNNSKERRASALSRNKKNTNRRGRASSFDFGLSTLPK